MKITIRGYMPDGTILEIEDWTGESNVLKHPVLVAYPKAKRAHNRGLYGVEEGNTYRVSFWFKNDNGAQEAFDKLTKGEAKLTDYIDNVSEPYKAKWIAE